MRIVQARALMVGSCLAATACMDGMGPERIRTRAPSLSRSLAF